MAFGSASSPSPPDRPGGGGEGLAAKMSSVWKPHYCLETNKVAIGPAGNRVGLGILRASAECAYVSITYT